MRVVVAFLLFLFCVELACADDFGLVDVKSPGGISFSFLKSSEQNTVALAVAFKGGLGSDGMTGPQAGQLVASLVDEGAGGKSAAELYELFQDVGGQFRLSVNVDQTYATLSAPSKGILGAAKLANLVLTQPDFPERKVLQQRETYAQRIEEYENYPDAKLQKAFLNAVAEPHPYLNYYYPSAEASRSVVQADLKAWMARHIARDGVLVSLVGNVAEAEASTIVDQLFAGIQDKSGIQPTPPMVFKAAPSQTLGLTEDTGDQAVITVGTAVPFNAKLEEWVAADMLSRIFSGDQKSRLFKDIREVNGASYGLQPSASFTEAALFNSVQGRIAKVSAEQTMARLKESWDRFRTEGPSDDEIANARASMKNYFGEIVRSHAAMANFVRDYLTGHWPTNQINALPSLVDNLNLRDKALLAKLYPENPIVVVVQ